MVKISKVHQDKTAGLVTYITTEKVSITSDQTILAKGSIACHADDAVIYD